MNELFFVKMVEGYLGAARYSNPDDCCLFEAYSVVSDELFDEAYRDISYFWENTKTHSIYKKSQIRPSEIGEAIWYSRNFEDVGLFVDYPSLKEVAEKMGMRFASKSKCSKNLLILS